MEAHEHEDAFWLGQVRVGVGLSVFVLVVLAGYLAATPEKPYRGLFWLLVVLGSVVTAVAAVVPWRTVIARGWTLRVLYSWSVVVALLLTAMTWLDGRDGPGVLMLVIPLVFGAMTYPPQAVIWLGAGIVGGQLVIGLQGENGLIEAPVRAIAFALVAAMGALTARNHTQQVERVETLAAELRRQADVDGLTGCLNHRAFHERLDVALSEVAATGRQLVVLSCDLDHFKRINDRHGHPTGDAVLAAVGTVLRSVVRAGDTVARVGGEEFVLVLSDVALDEAFDLAERIRRLIGEMDVPAPVTASLGIAALPGTASSKQELLDAADRALYAAKRAGRDRSVRADQLPAEGAATASPSVA